MSPRRSTSIAIRARGSRSSHLDLDTYNGTKAALDALYPRVSRGGVIVLDEYAVRGWGETDAVDEFLEGHLELQPQPVPYSAKPTAFFRKPYGLIGRGETPRRTEHRLAWRQ